MDKQKNALLRKYHTLLRKSGVNEAEKEALLASYGVESGKDLNVYELTELCDKLDKKVNPATDNMDKWRKRVLAAVIGYLRAIGKRDATFDDAKAVACRASKKNCFNKIPIERLKSLYNAFKNRENDLQEVDKVTLELLTVTRNMGEA